MSVDKLIAEAIEVLGSGSAKYGLTPTQQAERLNGNSEAVDRMKLILQRNAPNKDGADKAEQQPGPRATPSSIGLVSPLAIWTALATMAAALAYLDILGSRLIFVVVALFLFAGALAELLVLGLQRLEKRRRSKMQAKAMRSRPQSARDIFAEYQTSDAEAGRAQLRYKKVSALAIWSTVAATILAAAIACFDFRFGSSANIELILAVIAFLLYATALLATAFSKRLLFQEEWLVTRARAEDLRSGQYLHVFKQELEQDKEALARGVDGSNEQQRLLLLLKLEYARKYLLEDQYNWLKLSIDRHSAKADWSDRIQTLVQFLPVVGLIGMFVVGLSVLTEQGPAPALFQVLSSFLIHPETESLSANLMLFLLIATSALLSGTLAQAYITNDRSIASRYEITADNLDGYLNRLNQVRRRAAGGDWLAVRDFISDIRRILAQDLQAWMTLSNQNFDYDDLNRSDGDATPSTGR